MKTHAKPTGSSHYDAESAILTITRTLSEDRCKITQYLLEWCNDADFGKPALRLHKIGDDGEIIELYDQHKFGGVRQCSCPDYEFRGYNGYLCKHLAAVQNEIKAGRLKVPRSMRR